jgi:hypothetical protein
MSARNPNGSPPPQPSPAPGSGSEPEPVSDTRLTLFLAALTVALVLGYLLLNKLVYISEQEDCALAHRRNCGAVESPSNRQ